MFAFDHIGTLGICSEAKGLTDFTQGGGVTVKPFQPGYLQTFDITSEGQAIMAETKCFLAIGGSDFTSVSAFLPTDIHANIRLLLKEAVKKRLMADRRIGCLLSGGLDSSLVTALLVQCFAEVGCDYKIQTFSIGMEDSPDVLAARTVAKHLCTEHHEVRFTPEEGIAAIREVILSLESFDITTIRASVGMYLISKYIKEKTDTTVIFSGEGSDELCQGYIYFHKAPTKADGDAESRRLLHDLYLYDNLRADRATAAHGLEVRVPFLDKFFTSYYLSLPPEKRQPQDGVEKHLLRSAFAGTGLLPDEILWRPKEAFSDGVSSKKQSWFKLLQDHIEDKVSSMGGVLESLMLLNLNFILDFG